MAQTATVETEVREVGRLPKSLTEELRVRVQEFHGKPYLDARIWTTRVSEGLEGVCTKKGLTLSLPLWRDLVDMVDAELRRIAAGDPAD